MAWQAEDDRFMALAYAEAVAAGLRHEVPVGAVLVGADGTVLARDGNRTIELSDPTAHAELLVLRAAGIRQGNYRLLGATLFATLEPCLMCMGAMIHARLFRLVFAALDPKAGAAVSRYQIGRDRLLNHTLEMTHGPMALACGALLTDFFRARRAARGRLGEGQGREAH
jgi:tRNA(adenine34) deaminase